jgi:hypothetical protein
MRRTAELNRSYIHDLVKSRDGDDRRSTPRYEADPTITCLLAVPSGGTGTATERPATLIDLSQSGARMTVAPGGVIDLGLAWLRLDQPVPSPWIAGRLVAIDTPGWWKRHGPVVVRLAFSEPCPYEVFRLAVRGFGGHGFRG